jgi:uracil-DNA glycosylase
MKNLLTEINNCRLCEKELVDGIRPVLQVHHAAKILIAGQAPGLKVHQTGIPFDDKSGERLRLWMNIDKDTFYNPQTVAILPMAFCYPGKGKSGDLPPRPECANKWRAKVLATMPNIQLILAVGSYAQHWHLPETKKENLTNTVKHWQQYYQEHSPAILPLPHPSPRNNIWLAKNAWFERDVIPHMQKIIKQLV